MIPHDVRFLPPIEEFIEPDPEEPSAICNQCGGHIVVSPADKDEPKRYMCRRCHAGAICYDTPRPQNLAMSYAVGDRRRKERVL